MGIILDSVCGFLESAPDVAVCTPTTVFFALVCVGFLVGLTIGCAWKPKWAPFPGQQTQQPSFLCSSPHKLVDYSPPSSPSRSAVSPLKGFGSAPCLTSLMLSSPNLGCWLQVNNNLNPVPSSQIDDSCGTTSQLNDEKPHAADLVREEDLEYLHQLVEMRDGGPAWIQMMDRSTTGMTYQAWRRDAKNGPPQYRTRTVFEDASPEIVRDFFWDDEFRPQWDDMLASAATVDECLITGSMVVHWLRKFPFFCSDREYTIGRRIWESGRSYYCVTKGVPYPSIPRRDKPRRVDLYYSSWFIRAVESRRGDGQLTACEVVLFHYEDMGIPWEISKLGIRQGMWASVKKIEPGLLAYQTARASGAAPSQPAFMARITTKVNQGFLENNTKEPFESEAETESCSAKSSGRNVSKVLIIGAAVALACSIDQGLLGKACIFGIARTLGNFRKRQLP
ncbi:StAR-related lipid transfer protein 7, mitochondrial [Linum grandiflorum]